MKTSRRGSTIVAVMITVAFVSAMIGIVTSVSQFQSRNGSRFVIRSQAVAYGEAVLESLYDQWRGTMIAVTNSTDRTLGMSGSAVTAACSLPTASQIPLPAGVTVASWSITAVDPLMNPTTSADGRPVAEKGTSSSLRVRLNYLASITLNYARPGAGTGSVTVERLFTRAGRNLFDNFFFGIEPEIEFHPGPAMYVDGKVYVGGNLYTAHDSLHFLTDTTFLGSHTLNYRAADSRSSGTGADIQNGGLGDNWNLANPPRKGQEQKLFDTKADQLDPRFLDDSISNDTDGDGNKNNDGYHELIEEPTTGTDPLKLDADTNERLSQNADYTIKVTSSNTLTIWEGPATATSPKVLSSTDPAYIAIAGALTTNTALKDVREGDNVRVVTMDVGKIKTAFDTAKIGDKTNTGDGLLFYVMDTSFGTSVSTVIKNSSTGATTAVTSTKKRGVKLVNGASLPSVGMSVVTPNILYVQGDYNTGTTGTTKPASNTATSYTPPNDKPQPYVNGYTVAPSAVAADAVNILSNAWNDANSTLAQSSRVASSTTVNTAIIAGNVPTTTSSYSGGIENFARFHENWSNKYLTIHGAMVLTYNSQQAKGTWSAADYTPPNRRWYFETRFQDSNPPGFRVARTYERGPVTIR